MSAMRSAALAILALFAGTAPEVEASSANGMARAVAGLRGSNTRIQDKVDSSTQPSEASIVETLKALDTNGDGKVGRKEIEKFAKTQGLSAEEVRADFQDLDRNGNGELEASEIGAILAETDSASEPAAPAALPAKAAPAEVSLDAPPVTVKHVKPAAATAVKAEPMLDTVPQAMPVLDTVPQAMPQQTVNFVSEGELNMENLEKDAERQAGSVLAETLARQAQQMFQQGVEDEKRAMSFENLAKQLRGNMTALAQSANSETKRVAREATFKVGDTAISEVRRLKKDAEKNERAAKEHRDHAQDAMKRVLHAQAAMAESTRLLSTGLEAQ